MVPFSLLPPTRQFVQQKDVSFPSSSPSWPAQCPPPPLLCPVPQPWPSQVPFYGPVQVLLHSSPNLQHFDCSPQFGIIASFLRPIHPVIQVVNRHIKWYCDASSLPASQTFVWLLQTCRWRESLPAADTGHKIPASPISRVFKVFLVHPRPLTLTSPCSVWLGLLPLQDVWKDPLEILSLLPDATQSARLLLPLLKWFLQTWNLWLWFRRDVFLITFANVNMSQWALENNKYHLAVWWIPCPAMSI